MEHDSCAPEEFLLLFVLFLFAKLSYCHHHYLSGGVGGKKRKKKIKSMKGTKPRKPEPTLLMLAEVKALE